MSTSAPSVHNVTAVVPFLWVASMERSLEFYVGGLGFTIQNRWEVGGWLRWCWMSLGGAALMLQEGEGPKGGNGAVLYFQCADALAIYREAAARGVHVLREPQVGNLMWEVCFADPDGYKISFSSPTDVPEETLLSQVKN
jgi:predicted enzyme related to lactoylglutathione lyase